MSDVWNAVDRFIGQKLLGADEALDGALASSAAAGLPAINVSAPQGKLLFLLATIRGAKRVLEVGTLGGFSAIWFARAVGPGGRVVSLEIDPRAAEVARANIARAGVSDRVEIRLGPALDSLPKIAAEKADPFDFVFIDADKENNPSYFDWAVRLSRRGTVIVVDNVVRDGSVLDASSTDASVRGTRKLYEAIAADSRVAATAIQTVGSKGYDGFAMAVVTADV